jgi:hypothetical protein
LSATHLRIAIASRRWSNGCCNSRTPYSGIGISGREHIEQELGSCKLVIVVWSRHAIVSDWVKYEYAFCSARCPVLPVLIDDVEVPRPFDELQGPRLLGWPETDEAKTSAAFFDEVQQLVVGEDFPTSPEVRRFDLEGVRSSLVGIANCNDGVSPLRMDVEQLEREIGTHAREVVRQIEEAQVHIYNWKVIKECISAAEKDLSFLGDTVIGRSHLSGAFKDSLTMIEKAKTQINAIKSKHGPRRKKRFGLL